MFGQLNIPYIFGLFSILLLIIALFSGNDKLISNSISLAYGCTFGGLIAHIIRIKSGMKDTEIPLSKKQMLFVFSLLGLVILSMFLIKQFVADKSLAIILICALALISGIYALFYVKNCIRKNKLQNR
ncbi:MAG: hypothetical protein LBC68_11640 [Prevotellaceae bacterium]|nr:hypothetical protein [Prevotellaceae bacterium]